MRDKWTKWREAFGSETDYIIKLWACFRDPEQQSSFLETVKERKKANRDYSIYDDYPRSECATKRAMRDCMEFVTKHVKTTEKVSVKEKEPGELQKALGELVELGGHEYGLCLWPRREIA